MSTLTEAIGEREVLLEKNGDVLCAFTFELIGFWYPVDGVKYFMPMYNFN